MPLKFESETELNLGQRPANMTQDEGPTLGQTLGAAFRRENVIGSTIAKANDAIDSERQRKKAQTEGLSIPGYDGNLTEMSASDYFGDTDARAPEGKYLPADFNPYQMAIDHGFDEDEIDGLIKTHPQTKQDFDDYYFSLKRQREDREILNNSGASGIVAQMAAGVLDPTILLGGQAAIRGAKGINLAAKLVKTGKVAKGLKVGAEGMALAAVAGAEGTVAQEIGLQGTQDSRSVEESALNVAGAAVAAPVLIGGATAAVHYLGGRVGRYGDILKHRGQTVEDLGNKLVDDLDDVTGLETMSKNMDDVMNGTPGSMGAAATDIPDLAADSLKSAGGIERLTKNFSPVLRTLQSPSAAVRRISQNLFENSMLMNKITGGRYAQQIAVERLIKNVTQDAEGAIGTIRKAYTAYLKDEGLNLGQRVGANLLKQEGVMTFAEFKVQVTKAMRDLDDHSNMIVREAAIKTRAFYDKILARGKEAGVMPEWMSKVVKRDGLGDPSLTYINRIYNIDKIIREEGNWRETIRPHIEKAVRASINEFYQTHKAKLDRVDSRIMNLTRENGKLKDALTNQSKKGGGVDVRKIEKMADVDVADAQRRLAELSNEQFIASRNLQDVAPDAVAMSRYGELLRDFPDAQLAPDDIKAVIEQYNLQNILADVQFVNQKRPAKPDSLVDYLQKRGGVRDDGGELTALGIDNRVRPGFVNNRTFVKYGTKGKRGLALDEALRSAQEAGYLPDSADVDDLLQALGNHFRHDAPTYLDDDLETVNLLQAIDDTKTVLSDFGIDNPRQFVRDVYETAKEKRGIARDDLAAARDRQKLSKDISNQVRDDVKKNVAPRMVELYDYRKYFKQKVETQMRLNDKRIEELTARTKQMDAEFTAKLRQQYDIDNDMQAYVDEVIKSVTDKVTGRGAAKVPGFITMAERGPLKGRTFNIDDRLIEGYLNNDVEHLISSYAKSAGADTELAYKFGTLDVEEVVKEITNDYADLTDAVVKDKKLTPEARDAKLKELNEQLKSDTRDIRAGWDLMRGTYKKSDNPDDLFIRSNQALRTLNYMRLLGGVVMSSLSDLAMPIFVHGMRRYYGEYLPSLVTNLKGIKMQVKDARFLRIAMEHEQASWLSAYAELGDPHATRTGLERFISNMGSQFGKASGIVYWNNLGQKIASSLSQSRILQAVEAEAAGKISKSEAEYLRFLGIGRDESAAIAKEYNATRGIFGQYESGGVKIAGVERWTNDNAVRAYRAALGKDVDRQILQRGAGDLPLFMNTEIGKTITQFKSFSAAAHSKLMIAGMQRRDAAAVAGFAHLFAMGMMINYLKAAESGRELSDNPLDIIIDGVDRSGALPLLFEISNTADKVNIGPRSLLGLQQSSKYASRSAVDTIMGPSAGFLADTAQTVGAMAGDSPLSSSDVHRMRRLMIGNNLPVVRQFFDAMEDAYGPSNADQ